MEADVVVVGAGGLGLSAAWQLASRGLKVTLVDRYEPGSQTSSQAAGLANQVRDDPAISRIGIRSLEILTRFEELTGVPFRIHQNGSLLVGRNERVAEKLAGLIRDGASHGVEVLEISGHEARARAPYLDPTGAHILAFTPSDGYFEPRELIRAYLEAARRAGCEVIGRSAVIEILLEGGAVAGVRTTSHGVISAPIVVDSAGCWTRLLADEIDVTIPVLPIRHQLMITEPVPGVDHSLPWVGITDANVYVRPYVNGLLLGGFEENALAFEDGELPAHIEGVPKDDVPLRGFAAGVTAQIPALATTAIAEVRSGIPTMTPDNRFVLDQAPGIRGFFVVSGDCVGGLSKSAGVGEAMTDWIVEGAPRIDLSSFAMTRFDGRYPTAAAFREATLHRYAHRNF